MHSGGTWNERERRGERGRSVRDVIFGRDRKPPPKKNLRKRGAAGAIGMTVRGQEGENRGRHDGPPVIRSKR